MTKTARHVPRHHKKKDKEVKVVTRAVVQVQYVLS